MNEKTYTLVTSDGEVYTDVLHYWANYADRTTSKEDGFTIVRDAEHAGNQVARTCDIVEPDGQHAVGYETRIGEIITVDGKRCHREGNNVVYEVD